MLGMGRLERIERGWIRLPRMAEQLHIGQQSESSQLDNFSSAVHFVLFLNLASWNLTFCLDHVASLVSYYTSQYVLKGSYSRPRVGRYCLCSSGLFESTRVDLQNRDQLEHVRNRNYNCALRD